MSSPFVRTVLPATVSLDSGEGGLLRLTVINPLARAEVYLHGAHVTAWQPAGHDPVIWMSGVSQWSATKPIRGGVPICFPWFGPHPTDTAAPAHGFARLLDWTLVEARDVAGATQLVFELTPAAPPSATQPYAFTATYRVTVGSSLTLSLEVLNTGTGEFPFEEALHTYFAVQDVRRIHISGLEGVDYLDKVGGTATQRTQGPDPIRFTGETDRVYLKTQATCTIHDPGRRRRIVVGKDASDATVVWNPWVAKAKAMPDFGDDEWPGMVCVETANVNVHGVTLAPGGRHTMTATIDVAAE